jgi:hypothetical protein
MFTDLLKNKVSQKNPSKWNLEADGAVIALALGSYGFLGCRVWVLAIKCAHSAHTVHGCPPQPYSFWLLGL